MQKRKQRMLPERVGVSSASAKSKTCAMLGCESAGPRLDDRDGERMVPGRA